MLYKKFYTKLSLQVIFFSILVLGVSNLIAQTRNLDRPFDPVIITGEQISEYNGITVDEIFVAAFNAASGEWQIIPFQIDERDTAGKYVFPDSSDEITGFDANDEIVFMVADVGDQANIWLDNDDSQAYSRYEILITDTLDQNNNKTGYVYLYRSSTLTKNLSDDYVVYTPSADSTTGEDFVESPGHYKIGGNKKGLFGFLSLPQKLNVNLLDRQKIRGKTDFLLLPTFDEENDITFKRILAKDGPVRVIRELTFSLLEEDVPLPVQYFKNSVDLSGNLNIPEEIKILGLIIKITEIRHSIDLSVNAQGMVFSDKFNTNIPIDGIEDVINDTIEEIPEVNYTHITGEQGTIISLFQLPSTIGDNRKLFYLDKAGINDAGDGNSLGDTGILISGVDIEGEFPLALKMIFLTKNQPISIAEELVEFEENPLQTETFTQTFDEVTSVDIATNETSIPQQFALSQNFPNPFNPVTVIHYQLPRLSGNTSATNRSLLKVYNLLGREIRTLVEKEQPPGFYSVTWDAKNNSGKNVPSGVYFYQLKYGDYSETKKLLLVK